MKKPKLRNYLLRACAISLLAVILLAPAVLLSADRILYGQWQEMDKNLMSHIADTAREQLLGTEPSELGEDALCSWEHGRQLAQMDFMLKAYSGLGVIYGRLYDRDGRVLSDPSRSVFCSVLEQDPETGTETRIRLESPWNDAWQELFDLEETAAWNVPVGENDFGIPKDMTFGELADSGNLPGAEDQGIDCELSMDELYMQGGYFIPGRIHAIVTAGSLSREILSTDMTPEDPENYIKISCDPECGQEADATVLSQAGASRKQLEAVYSYGSATFPHAWGLAEENVRIEQFEEVMTKLADSGLSPFSDTKDPNASIQGSVIHDFSNENEWMEHLYAQIDTFHVSRETDAPEYYLITTSGFSIFRSGLDMGLFYIDAPSEGSTNLKTFWIPVCLICFALLLVLTCMAARIRYVKAKAAYDMRCYRIETTNAMAHDLKTPLTAISGYAENLLAQVQVDKREYYARAILSNISYMDQMIHDILELSKSEDIRQTLTLEQIRLAVFTEDALDSFRHLAKERQLVITVSGDGTVRTDRSLFRSMLENLISNAVKYAAEGSEIRIAIDKPPHRPGKVCLKVINSLPAPLEKPISELVKPYVKGDDSRGSRQGSGVGLAIVENAAAKLRYRISYDITGDTFSVSIMMPTVLEKR